jgi:hypothetical protein
MCFIGQRLLAPTIEASLNDMLNWAASSTSNKEGNPHGKVHVAASVTFR